MKNYLYMVAIFLLVISIKAEAQVITPTDQQYVNIREDIKNYIDQVPDNNFQKKSLEQMVRALNTIFLSDLKNTSQVRMTSIKLTKAIACIYKQYPSNIATQRSSVIERLYVNNKENRKFYALYNKSLSGTTSSLPEGNTCE